MNGPRKAIIARLPTGVPGLDEALGGGLPEYSFNLISGGPGTGKTTLAHQIMFANATPERPALHFTVLGEPPLKMLRYQQQLSFFDPGKLGRSIRYVDLGREMLELGLAAVLDTIVREVEEAGPGLVFVDSFRAVVRAAAASERGEIGLQGFLQRLAMHLTSWQATTFLIGEHSDDDLGDNPMFTMADGILWLSQDIERSSGVRKLRVVKMRGQAPMPGLHTLRITDDGLQVFPRILRRVEEQQRTRPRKRLSVGIAGLDEMLGGGIPEGDSVLVAGPSGAGKSVLATQFIADGARHGEPGVIAVFEEHPRAYVERAATLGLDLAAMIRQGALDVVYLRPLDLSVDEALHDLLEAVDRIGARRIAIDSLSGFELALAPTFREDFRESLYRMVGALTAARVTVLMTVEVAESSAELRFSPHLISFLADDIILQRYVELDGRLRKVLAVVKMRGSQHSKELRSYDVTDHGLVVGGLLEPSLARDDAPG